MYVFHVVITSPCKYCKVNKDRLCFYDVQIQGKGGEGEVQNFGKG